MKNLREKIMAASFGKLFRRWFIAALCVALLGGRGSAALFAAVRSLLGRKCPVCGSWQDKKAAYCAVCGSAMSRKCPACGADCPAGFHFCSACGMNLDTIGE